MAPASVPGQAAAGSSAASTAAHPITLGGAATAGNILWYSIGGDKDIGTLTMSDNIGTAGGANPWSVPVNLRSTSVSLVLAWKVAVGGETTITGTVTTTSANGSNVWADEYSEAGAGAWEIKSSATNNSDESNVLVWSTGTTGAASGAGRAIAAFSADSISTEGTASYSNSYSERANPSAGVSGGTGGLWVAERDVAAAATTECTITRAGGAAADQMSAAVVVFGRAAGGGGGGSVTQTRAMLGLL